MAIESELVGEGVDRRAVVRAAAWTAPIIVLARSVPARAASGLASVGPFAVVGTCYSRTDRTAATEFRIRWVFTLGATGLPSGTTIIIVTTGGARDNSYQISGSAIEKVGSSEVVGGTRTSTYMLVANVYTIDNIITGFYIDRASDGPAWTCSVNIVLPSGYVAASGSAPYGEVGEATPNTLACT